MRSTEGDRETVRECHGMFVGMMEPDEIEALDRCVADGIAARSYDNPAGFIGLSKVRWLGEGE